jgi:adenylate kinase
LRPLINLVLIGPPGSGKGTQAARLAERYRIPHISTGDILRAAVREGSTLGQQVSATMASGGLVSDGLMTELVGERLARRDVGRGFILDGFPRTVVQAETLDAMFSDKPLLVILIQVADEEIVRRLGLRRVCASCAITQSVSGPVVGQGEGEAHVDPCPYCGGQLIVRQDDNPETVRTRLRTHAAFATPVIDYFRSHREVAAIDGLQMPDAVTTALRSCIDAFAQRTSA